MALINIINGVFPSFLRCYRLSYGPEVIHLSSLNQLSSLSEIREVVAKHSQPESFARKAVLFVEHQHLPLDLRRQLWGLEALSNFLQVLAFCSPIYQLTLNNYQLGLPLSPSQHDSATHQPCPAFPITAPVDQIDPTDSLSFGREELIAFLGHFFKYSGKMTFLNLMDHNGSPYPPTAIFRNILRFMNLKNW